MKDNVIQVIANIIKVTPDEIAADIGGFSLGKVSGWDSLAHLAIMTEIEDEYDLDLSIDEMEELNSVAKILKFLEV
ncbi:acyl carrier protein [Porticoccaceae bacterium]|nr:acyl carrier protein [Porticoccaceae bacterium]